MGSTHEIEVKILEIDVDAIIRKLEGLGAVKTGEGPVTGVFFVPKDGFSEKKHLRLRTLHGKTELCLKIPVSKEGAKIMDERETVVDDYDATRSILLGLGFEEIKPFSKRRTSYVLGEIHFEIDTVEGIPPYLEVEASSIDEVKRGVEMLGLSMADAKPWGGKELRAHYGVDNA